MRNELIGLFKAFATMDPKYVQDPRMDQVAYAMLQLVVAFAESEGVDLKSIEDGMVN